MAEKIEFYSGAMLRASEKAAQAPAAAAMALV
jgi:hypothetical protein